MCAYTSTAIVPFPRAYRLLAFLFSWEYMHEDVLVCGIRYG